MVLQFRKRIFNVKFLVFVIVEVIATVLVKLFTGLL